MPLVLIFLTILCFTQSTNYLILPFNYLPICIINYYYYYGVERKNDILTLFFRQLQVFMDRYKWTWEWIRVCKYELGILMINYNTKLLNYKWIILVINNK